MKYLLVVSALLLSACGPMPQIESDPRTISGIDPTFDEQVQVYLHYKPGNKLNYDIPIGFGELDGNTVGLCTRWSNGYRQIIIDEYYWYNQASEDQKRSLIAHELGHCDLNRDHSSLVSSIMYYLNYGSQDYDELFGISSIQLAYKTTHNHDASCVEDIEVE
jgi:hypothetical protein